MGMNQVLQQSCVTASPTPPLVFRPRWEGAPLSQERSSMLGWWPCIYGFPLLQQALCEDGTGLVTILYNCQSNSYIVGVEAVFSLFCPCRRTMTNHLYLEWNHAEYYAANIYCLWCSVIKDRRYLYSLSQNWWDTCMVSLFQHFPMEIGGCFDEGAKSGHIPGWNM